MSDLEQVRRFSFPYLAFSPTFYFAWTALVFMILQTQKKIIAETRGPSQEQRKFRTNFLGTYRTICSTLLKSSIFLKVVFDILSPLRCNVSSRKKEGSYRWRKEQPLDRYIQFAKYPRVLVIYRCSPPDFGQQKSTPTRKKKADLEEKLERAEDQAVHARTWYAALR